MPRRTKVTRTSTPRRPRARREPDPTPDPTPDPEPTPQPEPDPEPGDPEPEPEVPPDEPEARVPVYAGPLSEIQSAIRTLLDADQIGEVRLALIARRSELEKHRKKGTDLGVRELDAMRRLRILDGDDTAFGLLLVFAPEAVSETVDMFFDATPSANGASAEEPAEVARWEPTTVTFRTVDGRDITTTPEGLAIAGTLLEVRALHRAGILPSNVERVFRERDLWHLVEDAGADSEQLAGAEA